MSPRNYDIDKRINEVKRLQRACALHKADKESLCIALSEIHRIALTTKPFITNTTKLNQIVALCEREQLKLDKRRARHEKNFI